MKDNKNILIVNHYPYNKGDHAVLRVLISKILECWPNASIIVSSLDPYLTKEFNKEIITVPWPIDLKNIVKLSGFYKYFYGAASLFKGIYWSEIGVSENHPLVKYIEKSDIVISPGGHLFTTMNHILVLLSYSSSIVTAKKKGKPVFILSQTIGPFEGKYSLLAKWATKKAIESSDLITLREQSSIKYMNDFKFNKNKYKLAGELVFLLKPKVVHLSELNMHNKLKVGITIHHSYFKYWMTENEYTEYMGKIVSGIIEKLDAMVYFIPMEYNIVNKKEKEIIEKIKKFKNLQKYSDRLFIVPSSISPEETLYVISQMDIMLPTKLHSIILSLTAETPLLAIAYHQKTYNFMNSFNLEKYTIHINEIRNPELVINKIKHIIENREIIIENIRKHLSQQKRKADLNIYLLKDILGEC